MITAYGQLVILGNLAALYLKADLSPEAPLWKMGSLHVPYDSSQIDKSWQGTFLYADDGPLVLNHQSRQKGRIMNGTPGNCLDRQAVDKRAI